MNISVSIFDVFANAIPGSLYLVIMLYVGVRFGWVDWSELAGIDTTFALVGAILASYLLGQSVGTVLRRPLERTGLWGTSTKDVRETFRRRNPTVASRPFVDADVFTLLAGLRQVSSEAAHEVDRSRAAGIMLRSASPAFLMGVGIALVETIVTGEVAAVVAGIGMLALAALSWYEGQKRNVWARMHTFECALWMPNADACLAPPEKSP
jgi:hypothetical protein